MQKKQTEKKQGVAKSNSEKYIDKTLKAQGIASNNARLKYEKTVDPKIVIEFIKNAPAGSAFYESWVIEIIREWWINEHRDLFKRLFLLQRGKNKEKNKRILQAMMFAERIDKSRQAGQTIEEACITELEKKGGANLAGTKLEKKLGALKQKYNRAKVNKTEFAVIQNDHFGAWTSIKSSKK